MPEHDHGRTRGQAGEILGEPGELIVAKMRHAAWLQIGDIVERDEMHAVMIEAVPAGADRALSMMRASPLPCRLSLSPGFRPVSSPPAARTH